MNTRNDLELYPRYVLLNGWQVPTFRHWVNWFKDFQSMRVVESLLNFEAFTIQGSLQILISSLDPTCHRSPWHKRSFPIWILFPAQELLFLDLQERKSTLGKYKDFRKWAHNASKLWWILQDCLASKVLL